MKIKHKGFRYLYNVMLIVFYFYWSGAGALSFLLNTLPSITVLSPRGHVVFLRMLFGYVVFRISLQ